MPTTVVYNLSGYLFSGIPGAYATRTPGVCAAMAILWFHKVLKGTTVDQTKPDELEAGILQAQYVRMHTQNSDWRAPLQHYLSRFRLCVDGYLAFTLGSDAIEGIISGPANWVVLLNVGVPNAAGAISTTHMMGVWKTPPGDYYLFDPNFGLTLHDASSFRDHLLQSPHTQPLFQSNFNWLATIRAA
jgi:hypothetical protein